MLMYFFVYIEIDAELTFSTCTSFVNIFVILTFFFSLVEQMEQQVMSEIWIEF